MLSVVARQAAAVASPVRVQSLRIHGVSRASWAMAGSWVKVRACIGRQIHSEAALQSRWEVKSIAQVGAKGESRSVKAAPKAGIGDLR